MRGVFQVSPVILQLFSTHEIWFSGSRPQRHWTVRRIPGETKTVCTSRIGQLTPAKWPHSPTAFPDAATKVSNLWSCKVLVWMGKQLPFLVP